MKNKYILKEYITEIIITDEEEMLQQIAEAGVVVFDNNTYSVFKQRITGREDETDILERLIRKAIILMPGEESKNWDSVRLILETAVKLGLNRSSVFLGIGGGVVCDMTAFAASVYMRGARVRLIPTSLLAMVDAAFGGKTGFDFEGYKNFVGTFFPAEKLLIDTDWITYLPEREFRCGLAEAIKTAMLGDGKLLTLLEERQNEVLSREKNMLDDLVFRCLAVKGRIVEQDLRESGVRATLNLGHTFGHALESVSGFSIWSHGEAVAWGIAKGLELGVSLEITPESYRDRIFRLLSSYSFELRVESNQPDRIIEAMSHDKKNQKEGEIVFILQRGPEDSLVETVDPGKIRTVLIPSHT